MRSHCVIMEKIPWTGVCSLPSQSRLRLANRGNNDLYWGYLRYSLPSVIAQQYSLLTMKRYLALITLLTLPAFAQEKMQAPI